MGYFLPKEFRFNHTYCFFLHDCLVDIIKNGEKSDKFSVRIDFDKQEPSEEIKDLKGEELWDWLSKKGFKNDIDMLTYKQMYIALLSDFCHYIYTALKCSEKGKLSVTYSLLRKPLKDHLFLFEWLLADPNDLINKFNSDKSYVSIASDQISRENKLKIMNKVQEIISLEHLDPKFIFDIRYNKKIDYGLETLWQKATHIITTFKHCRTEKGNLNFVFSDEKAKIAQWKHLYVLLPILMYYTLWICIYLYYGSISKDEKIDPDLINRINVGLLLSEKISSNSYNHNFEKEDYQKLEKLSIKCKKCDNEINLDKSIIDEIINEFNITCSCGNKLNFLALLQS